mgnify:CR=1 FL=1
MLNQTSTDHHGKLHGGLRFDGTVNAGHLLTFIGMAVAGFMTFLSVDKRVTVLEEAKLYQREKDRAQDETQNKAEQEIGRRLEKIDNKLDSVIEFVRPMRRP